MTEGLTSMEYLTWRVAQLHDKIDGLNQKLHDSEQQILAENDTGYSELKGLLQKVKAEVKPEQDLWDNWDLIQNWNVSARTIAEWRVKGLIGFVQVGNKIWYPRESRELFLKLHFNKPKNREERDRDGE